MKVYFLGILLFVACATFAFAFSGKKHKKDSITFQSDSTGHDEQQSQSDGDKLPNDEGMKINESKVTATLNEFPSLHPLIVHFAIVLIIIAAAIQLINVFLLNKEIAWIISGLILFGFLAALIASKNYHPHTIGLSYHAKLVLKQHDNWADWTIYTTLTGLIAQTFHLVCLGYKRQALMTPVAGLDDFISKLNRGCAIIVGVILLSAALCVAKAGYYGAQLVHIEGVGPQGKFLEMEHHH